MFGVHCKSRAKTSDDAGFIGVGYFKLRGDRIKCPEPEV